MPRDAGRRVVLDVESVELRRELGPSAVGARSPRWGCGGLPTSI